MRGLTSGHTGFAMSALTRTLLAAALLPAVITIAACSRGGEAETPAPRVADEATVRTIPQGELVGYVSELNSATAHAWLGIPFAQAPVDDLRWRAPRAAEAWDGQFEALEFSDWCVQYTTGLDAGFGLPAGELHGSEDCLYLNVYAPPFAVDEVPSGDAALPVMVWIHGGGNVWGRAEQFDGSALAAQENVIVVTIQYRLGPLGWLAHPALRDTADLMLDRTANFGTLDMVASLAWVRENIGAFGGDAGNVTIFGESAGGHDVASLLVVPQAAGLFHRAIIQSGSTDTVPLDIAEGSAPDPLGRGMPAAIDIMNSIIAFIAPPTPEQMAGAMRSIDVETLYAAYFIPDPYGDLAVNPPRVIADGVVLPVDGILLALERMGPFNPVPVMAGTNRDETKLFNALDPLFTDNYFSLIIRPKNQHLYDLVSEYQTAMWQVRGVDAIAGTLRRAGRDNVYAYRFDWDEEGSLLLTDFSTLLGAAHSWEIPFIFNNWNYAGRLDRFMWTGENAESRLALSRAMMSYWAEFARTGNPGEAGGFWWEPWRGGQRVVFDTATDGGIRMEQGAYTRSEVWENLAMDTTFAIEEDRCFTYRAVIAWWPDTAPESFMDGACEGAATN